MLLDKFSKAPKFSSQMTKVYNLSGQYLWLLYLVSFLMLKEISKENISMHLSVVRPGCVPVGGMVVVQLAKQLQRLNSCSSKALARPPLWRTWGTCETLLSSGFPSHLTCYVMCGRWQRVTYPSAHPSVTPARPRGALWLVGPVALVHSLYQSWWHCSIQYSPVFVAYTWGESWPDTAWSS